MNDIVLTEADAIADLNGTPRPDNPTGKPISTVDVIAAIYAVGAEAARRGNNFPQISDEQLEDRKAVARVAGMLQWYEENTGNSKLAGWPRVA